MKSTIVIAAIAAALAAGGAHAAGDSAPAPFVTHYGLHEDLYHVVADKRFVGSFAPTKDACAVNVLVGPADEHDATLQPVRLTLTVASAQSVIIQAADSRSLAIACGPRAESLDIQTVDGAKVGLAQTN